ncbi:MAG: glycosyltransferase family 2 protein [Sedimentisphaerales bacterium]
MERSTYKSINVVIPVYNEGENIISTLSEMEQKVKTPYKVYIVYDFDEDNTLPVVKDYMQRVPNIRLVKNKFGKGAANAIKSGFEAVEDGVVLVVMADLSDDLGKADEMFEKINEGYDVVCGSRYMKGGKQIGGPWFKKLLSRGAGVSLHYLIGVPTYDITNSFKMYTKRLLNDITIESDSGFELGMEIVLKAFIKGHKITEVPSVWRDRTAGGSRFRLWKWLPKYLTWYWFGIKGRILKVLALR